MAFGTVLLMNIIVGICGLPLYLIELLSNIGILPSGIYESICQIIENLLG